MNEIISIASNRLNALQMTGNGMPADEQLISITVTVVDDQSRTLQAGVPIYWGFAGVNAEVLEFYDSNKRPFNINTQTTPTESDGTASLHVGSHQMCIAQIMASLSTSNSLSVGTTIAIWTVGAGGNLPNLTITVEDGLVKIPVYMNGVVPPVATNAYAFLGTNYHLVNNAPYVAWMCQGADTSQLGEVLAIGDYNGQDITIPVPYEKMRTDSNSSNSIAYMVYSNRQGAPSGIYSFGATGQAMVRPDDNSNPPEGKLRPPLFVEPDSNIIDEMAPPLLSLDSFDSKSRMNFAIPDYNGRFLSDQIAVTAYMNAWHQGTGEPNNVALNAATLTGSEFTDGYARFIMLWSDCQDFCPYPDSGMYGYIWIQYVINNMRYSPSLFTLIDFCNE